MFVMSHQSHPLDVGVLNECPAKRAIVAALTRLLVNPCCRIAGQRTLNVLRQRHGPGRMCERELKIPKLEQVRRAKLGSSQALQFDCIGHRETRREAEHLFVPEHQQAVAGKDRGVLQDQVVILAPPDPNDGLVVFEINGAEDGSMVNELKHRGLFRVGFQQAIAALRRGRPGHIS